MADPIEVSSIKQDNIFAVGIGQLYHVDSVEKYAEIYRNLIVQENLRINERSTWLLQLQGLLFAALAFGWEKQKFLVFLLSSVGILSTIAIGNGLRWATRAIDEIEVEWENKKGNYAGPRVTGLGKKDGLSIERLLLLHPPYTLPVIFIIAWLVVLVYRLTH